MDNQIVSLIIELAVSIAFTIILYYAFKKFGFKGGVVVTIVSTIIKIIANGSLDTFKQLSSFGTNYLLFVIVVLIVCALIYLAIDYLIFKHVSGLLAFFIFGVLWHMILDSVIMILVINLVGPIFSIPSYLVQDLVNSL